MDGDEALPAQQLEDAPGEQHVVGELGHGEADRHVVEAGDPRHPMVDQARHGDVTAERQGRQVDLVAGAGQHAAHVGDVERRAGDREERLRRHEQDAVRRACAGARARRRRRGPDGRCSARRRLAPLRQQQGGAAEVPGEAKPAVPPLDLARQGGPLQGAMHHERHQELLLFDEVGQPFLPQHRRQLAPGIAEERPRVALDPALHREQQRLEQVGAHLRRVLDQQALPAYARHLRQQRLPALDMREQADRDDEVEASIVERQRPEVRGDEMQPPRRLRRDGRQTVAAGRGAALHPDVEAHREQQARELAVAAADVERAPALKIDPREQTVRRLGLHIQQIGADRSGKASRVARARGLDVGRDDVVLEAARRMRPVSSRLAG